MRSLWKLHQWFGVLTCFGILLWGLSGVLHPVMSRLQPKPVKFMPPQQQVELQQAMPLGEILQQRQIEFILGTGVVTLQGQSYYRVQLPEYPEASYFGTDSGQPMRNADARYAEQLARYYTGLTDAPLTSIALISQFDADYPEINRFLPVWRVQFAEQGNLRAYIDTQQSRLATLSNDTRLTLTSLFRLGHNWSFLERMPVVQVGVMSLMLFATCFSAMSGMYFYWRLRPSAAKRLQKDPIKRSHRIVGGIVSLFALMATVSGIYHLLHTYQSEPSSSLIKQPQYSTQELLALDVTIPKAQPISQLSLGRIDQKPVWQASWSSQIASSGPRAQVANLTNPPDEHAQHASAARGKDATKQSQSAMVFGADRNPVVQGEEKIAQQLASQYAQQPIQEIQSTTLITKFTDEYGFLMKRLPVYRVEFSGDDHPRYYVETATGALAARIDDGDALEGRSFSWLHKWSFLDINKDVRDFLLAAFAFANVVVALLGMKLFLRRRRLPRSSQVGAVVEVNA